MPTGRHHAEQTTRKGADTMQIYIPASYHAAIMLFRRGNAADHARIDAIRNTERQTAERIFNGIMDGTTSEAHQRYNNGYNLRIFHRSTRHNFIQESHFIKINGQWEASSHRDIYSPADIELTNGTRITITA